MSTSTHPLAASTRRSLIKGAAAAVLAATPFARALSQGTIKLTVAYPTRSGASWPVWIAKHMGLYEKHQLDVTPEFGVHPAGVAMLISGQAQMALYGLEPVLGAAVRDPSLVLTGSSLSKGNFALVAGKAFKTVQELKGKRIGIGRVGDQLYFYVLSMLQKHGLSGRDVQWIPTGADVSSRVKMLQVGQIDGALLVAPGYFKLEEQGFNVLDLLINHPDIYVSIVNVYKRSWLKDNLDVATRLTMAQAEAVQLFYQDKDAALRAYRAFDPSQSEADIARLYGLYKAKDVLDRVPLLQKAAMLSTTSRMAEELPAIKRFDPSTIVDQSVLRKLIAEGYFRKLFGPGVAAEENAKLAASY